MCTLSRLMLSLVLVLVCSAAQAQFMPDYGQLSPNVPRNEPKWTDRLVPSGNLSFNVSGNNIFLDVSPGVMYAVTPKWIIGPGVNFMYRSFSNVSSTTYGGRVSSRYTVFQSVFLSADYLLLNVERIPLSATDEGGRLWYSMPLVGGGMYFPFTDRVAGFIGIQYNLNQNRALNPYRQFGPPLEGLILNVGVGF